MDERRSRFRAWAGTLLFLLLAPGVVAGVIPWLITQWRIPEWGAWLWLVLPVAGVLILAGVAFLLTSFVRFALAGGTPAPPEPTQRLVVEGPYRYVRNPMYLAVSSIILGQVVLFASWWLLGYLLVVLLAVVVFVRGYEEPTLERTYGDQYRRYRRNVPGWWPRRTPWEGG